MLYAIKQDTIQFLKIVIQQSKNYFQATYTTREPMVELEQKQSSCEPTQR